MMFNYRVWNNYFKQIYIPQISSLIEVLVNRVLPTFEGIEKEAEEREMAEYERLISLPSDGDIEMSDLAELATDAGISHYELMTGIRQGIVNMFAANLYHVFEQQVMQFHRKEVLDLAEENDENLFKLDILLERLAILHINIPAFNSWETIEELHLVANTVKHAEGRSSNQLHVLRSDLFIAPYDTDISFQVQNVSSRVYKPLMGEDLYISLDDIRLYGNAIIKFWEELSEAISK